MSKILNVTDETFEQEVLQADQPVLVDFWAPWCGPCKMIAPVLEELSGVYDGKIKVCKVDVDVNKNSPAKFNVRGIPTLIIFKGGNAESTKVGALSRAQLTAFIDSNL
jgi:thioredoxin 1